MAHEDLISPEGIPYSKKILDDLTKQMPFEGGRTYIEDETNPKDLVAVNKPPIELVPPIQEILTSLAFKDGAVKYGPFNWRTKKVRYSIYYAAATRHLKSAYDGEDIDPISKVMHLAHASACIAILMDAWATGNLIDDRPPAGSSSKIINEYMENGNVG
jgi:hypothetical protein